MTVESAVKDGGIVYFPDGTWTTTHEYVWVRVPEEHGGEKATVLSSKIKQFPSGMMWLMMTLDHHTCDVIEVIQGDDEYDTNTFLWVRKEVESND